jgi:hypothetical protein
LAALRDWLVSIAGASNSVAVAIVVPHGPVVDALQDRGFAVYAINPKQLDVLAIKPPDSTNAVASRCSCPRIRMRRHVAGAGVWRERRLLSGRLRRDGAQGPVLTTGALFRRTRGMAPRQSRRRTHRRQLASAAFRSGARVTFLTRADIAATNRIALVLDYGAPQNKAPVHGRAVQLSAGNNQGA